MLIYGRGDDDQRSELKRKIAQAKKDAKQFSWENFVEKVLKEVGDLNIQ
jgi:predicted site-specific integrase-resolvase